MLEPKISIVKLKGYILGVVDIEENETWVKRYSYTPSEQDVLKDYNIRLRIIRRNLK